MEKNVTRTGRAMDVTRLDKDRLLIIYFAAKKRWTGYPSP